MQNTYLDSLILILIIINLFLWFLYVRVKLKTYFENNFNKDDFVYDTHIVLSAAYLCLSTLVIITVVNYFLR